MLMFFTAPAPSRTGVFPDTFSVRVRWRDIWKGEAGTTDNCPIARALLRQTGLDDICVRETLARCEYFDDHVAHRCWYSHDAQHWILRFDRFGRRLVWPRTVTFTKIFTKMRPRVTA